MIAVIFVADTQPVTTDAGKAAFTEEVQKGADLTYRARFSGFSEKDARDACQQIKRKNMSCYVVAPNS